MEAPAEEDEEEPELPLEAEAEEPPAPAAPPDALEPEPDVVAAPELCASELVPAVAFAITELFWAPMLAMMADCEAEMAVALPMAVMLLLPAPPEVTFGTAEPVTAGTRKVWMSDGRAVNQVGVWPAAN